MCNRKKDGSTYWVATTIVPFLNEQGKPYQYVSIRFDRTEAKLAKEELIRKNTQISSLLESINDAFIGLDKDLRYTYVNQRTCQLVGLPADKMIGHNIWDLFPDAVGSATWDAVQHAVATCKPVVNEDYYAPLDLWQENHIYPNENGLSIFINDITWRKREEEQKDMLTEISSIFNNSASLPALMERVVARLIKLRSTFCFAETWLLARDGRHLVLGAQNSTNVAVSVFFKEHPDFNKLFIGEGLPGRTWQEAQILFWADLSNEPAFLRQKAALRAGIKSAFGIPLRHGEQLIGVLLLGQTTIERPEKLNNGFLTRLGNHLGAEISRRQIETDLENFFEVAPDVICILGTDRYFKKVNPSMCLLLGYTEAELLQMQIDQVMHPEEMQASRARMQRFINGEVKMVYFENRYMNRSGEVIHLAWTAARGEEEGILFCIARNISDKKQLEETANRFLMERNNILESIGDAFFSVDRGWNVLYWNHVAEEILQIPKEKVLGKNLWKAFGDSGESAIYKEYHEAMRSGKVRHFEEYSQMAAKWYDISVYPSESGLSVFFKDITQRKHAERELEISNQRYSDLFQLSPLPMFVYSANTFKYLDVNQAAIAHYGYSREEFLSMGLRDIRPADQVPLLDKILSEYSNFGNFHKPGTFIHKKRDGELIDVEITSSELLYNGELARVALAIDVTERNEHLKAIEEQNEKLKEISWMQSHIIRAPLSRIMGLIDLMQTVKPDTAETMEILQYIQLSARELDDVIKAITDNAHQP